MSEKLFTDTGLDWAQMTAASDQRAGALFELGQLDSLPATSEIRRRKDTLCGQIGLAEGGNEPGLGWEERVLARTIPATSRRAAAPKATIALAQPGAGGGTLLEGLRRTQTGLTCLDSAEMVLIHPGFSKALASSGEADLQRIDGDADRLAGLILQQAIELGLHLAIPASFQNADAARGLLTALRDNGYQVEILFACVAETTSHAVIQRWPPWRTRACLGTSTVVRSSHATTCEMLRRTLATLEASGLADRITTVTADGLLLRPVDGETLTICESHLRSIPISAEAASDRVDWRTHAKVRLRERAQR